MTSYLLSALPRGALLDGFASQSRMPAPQPPLPLHSFLPAQSWPSPLQPPRPLQAFLPEQQSLLELPLFVVELPAFALEEPLAGAFSAQPIKRPETAAANNA